MGRSKSTICEMVKRWNDTKSFSMRNGRGRKRKTTEREDRIILNAIKSNPLISSAQIKRDNPIIPVSVRSIRNRRTESGSSLPTLQQ